MVLLPSFFDGLCEGPDGGPFQRTQAPFVLGRLPRTLRGTLPSGAGKASPEAGGAVPSEAPCSQVCSLERPLCGPAAAWLE